jgi:integrase
MTTAVTHSTRNQEIGRRSGSTPQPRRIRVAKGVYRRLDRRTGKRVPGKFEFTYRDAGRQRWQTATGETKADAKAERAELKARLHRGERVERTNLTVGYVARLWLERGTGQKGRWAPSTLEGYERIVRLHIERSTDTGQMPLASVKLRELSIDRVAAWSGANERALAPTTAVIALVTLGQICRFAVRRGWLASNPVSKLEPAEKPHWTPQQVAILECDELAALLEHAPPSSKFLFEFLAHTGLRISEAFGLCWVDIDYDAGLIRVHRQLSRKREHTKLKTAAGKREVILAPSLARALREHWLASRHKEPTDFVFANTLGRGLDYRKVGENFRQSLNKAGLSGRGQRVTLSLPPPQLCVAPDRQWPRCRLRQPPARPRPPRHHAPDLFAPVRPTRSRRRCACSPRCELHLDQRQRSQHLGGGNSGGNKGAGPSHELADFVWGSRQPGHANPSITLEVLRAPFRARRPRTGRTERAGGELRSDGSHPWIVSHAGLVGFRVVTALVTGAAISRRGNTFA